MKTAKKMPRQFRATYELLSVGHNSKMMKGGAVVASLSLAPADTVPGINVCPNAKRAGCLDSCIYTAGHGRFASTQAARIRRTEFLRDDRAGFMAALDADIKHFGRDCLRWRVSPVVRLNAFSDLNFNKIIRANPSIQFYDYVKRPGALKHKPDNLHLTLSYSTTPDYLRLITPVMVADRRQNIAVVFEGKKLPREFLGRTVIDGDADDRRYMDPLGVIVGLRAKKTLGNTKQSALIVKTGDFTL